MNEEISCALLAEPHHGLAEGTRSLLATIFDTVVMVADEGSLVELTERIRPRLLIVDLVLARRQLAPLIARIRRCSSCTKVLVLSVHDEPSVADAVMEAGADAFLVRGRIGTELLTAVQAIIGGENDARPRGGT